MPARQHLVTRTRCALVALAATAGAAPLLRELAGSTLRPVATVDEALVRMCLGGLLVAVLWAWLATLSVVVEAWRGRPRRRRTAGPLRRVVLLSCGVALAAPVGAASGDEHPAPAPVIAGLPLPERATGPARPAQPTHPQSSGQWAARTVVVRPGDCLWHLAAADLPANASAARITERWHAIHRLNVAVIGPDPDLIHPGQRLALPPR